MFVLLAKLVTYLKKLKAFYFVEYGSHQLKCPNCGRRKLYKDGRKTKMIGIDIKYAPEFSDVERTVKCTCLNCGAAWGLPSLVPNKNWRIGTK
jgi:hypothetical protein